MYRTMPIWISAMASVLAGAAWQISAAAAAPQTEIVVTGESNTSLEQVHRVVVRYGDLRLDQPSGVAVLHDRITTAADNACGADHLTGQSYVSPFWRRCVKAAVDEAVAAVNRPDLTAYHDRHS